MTRRRKTDGERIANKLFGISVQDQEAKWLAAEVDSIVSRRAADAWVQGYRFREVVEELETKS